MRHGVQSIMSHAGFLFVVGLLGCGDSVASTQIDSGETSLAAASAPVPPVIQSASAAAALRASATTSPSSLWGPISGEARAKLGKISRYDREGRFHAALAIPEGWADRRLEDGMSGSSFGILTRPSDKPAPRGVAGAGAAPDDEHARGDEIDGHAVEGLARSQLVRLERCSWYQLRELASQSVLSLTTIVIHRWPPPCQTTIAVCGAPAVSSAAMSLIETPRVDPASRAVDRERERPRPWRIVPLLLATSMIACGEAETTSAASAPPSVTTAASNSSARAVSSDVVPAVTSPTASSSAPPIASSWFGPAPSGKSLLDPPIAVYTGKFDARLSVPEGWTHARLTDGMSGNLFGLIARPTDKSAVLIVIVHEATHESLLEFGAERWLGISGGARDLAWGKVEPAPGAGDDFSLRRGRGKLWGKPAEVVQLRRRVPSVEKGPHTLLLLGAVADAAPASRRDAYVACLASYAVSVP